MLIGSTSTNTMDWSSSCVVWVGRGCAEYSQTSQSNKNNEPIEEPQTKKSAPQVNPTNPPVNENEFVTASEDLGKMWMDGSKGGRWRAWEFAPTDAEHGNSPQSPLLKLEMLSRTSSSRGRTTSSRALRRRVPSDASEVLAGPSLFFVQAVVLWL